MPNDLPDKVYPQKPEDIEKLVFNHYRRLQKLKERAAIDGKNIPPEVLIEIEDIEKTLEELGVDLNVHSMVEYQKAVIQELKSAKIQLSKEALQKVIEVTYDKFIDIALPEVMTIVGQVYARPIGSLYIEIAQKDQRIGQLEKALTALWDDLSVKEKSRLSSGVVEQVGNIFKNDE